MKSRLPGNTADLLKASWADFEDATRELAEAELNAENLKAWMADWSTVASKAQELYSRLYCDTTLHTNDKAVEERFTRFMDEFFPKMMEADQRLKEKLLASGLEPEGFNIPSRNMRAEAALFRQENLPLISETQKLSKEYDKIVGSQTVQWDGQEVTLSQLRPVYLEQDRSRRESAWRLSMQRWYDDRDRISAVWQKLLPLRLQIASNAGYGDYRSYSWQDRQRFDYTPADCMAFHDAIEEVVVPAAKRIYERRRQKMGLDTLRPWDIDVDPTGLPALKPFSSVEELTQKSEAIFHHVDPVLGGYFSTMVRENLLDLGNRKHKAPGAYSMDLPDIKRPFIFANAVGVHDDVATVLHESGHAFHYFESSRLPYYQQVNPPMEFAEVGSMAMELLAAPYMTAQFGGFYTPSEAARARIEHIEGNILFWPYMSVVDSFQHWVYENPEAALDADTCDRVYGEIYDRFMPGVDWSGFDQFKVSRWQRQKHILEYPFYYIEYGLAQLGATLIYGNAVKDQKSAFASYRKALALGGTATLPDLFKTAGARLAFDSGTLKEAIDLLEAEVEKLQQLM